MLNVLRKILNPRKSNFSQPRPGILTAYVGEEGGNLIESFMGKLSLTELDKLGESAWSLGGSKDQY